MQNKTKISLNFIQNPSILIIRLSSIGDIILTTHIPRILRNKFPNSEIDYLTFNSYAQLLQFNPRIDNLLSIEKQSVKTNEFNIYTSKNEHIFDLKKYAIIIDLQNNKYSHKILNNFNLFQNSEILSFNKNRFHKLALVYLKKGFINNFNIPMEYLKTVSTLNIENDELGLELWFEGEKEYSPFFKNNKSNKLAMICIAPGAAHKTKQWLPDRFSKLIKVIKEKYNSEIILLGGKNEIELNKQIQLASGVAINNYTGQLSLLETAKYIDSSDLLVCNDTGLMHIAAARKVPIITIFGSSVKELGFSPYKTKFKIVEKNLWCRPCSHIGRSFCPLGNFNCMKLIEVQDVINEIERLIFNL